MKCSLITPLQYTDITISVTKTVMGKMSEALNKASGNDPNNPNYDIFKDRNFIEETLEEVLYNIHDDGIFPSNNFDEIMTFFSDENESQSILSMISSNFADTWVLYGKQVNIPHKNLTSGSTNSMELSFLANTVKSRNTSHYEAKKNMAKMANIAPADYIQRTDMLFDANESLTPLQIIQNFPSLNVFNKSFLFENIALATRITQKVANQLVKRVIIDVENGRLVQIDEIDSNLKQFREDLKARLVQKLGIDPTNKSEEVIIQEMIEYFKTIKNTNKQKFDKLEFNSKNLNDILNEMSSSDKDEFLEDYMDFVLFANFDWSLELFGKGIIVTAKNLRNDYNTQEIKYFYGEQGNIRKSYSDEMAINALGEVSNVFNLILDNSPMYNIIDGKMEEGVYMDKVRLLESVLPLFQDLPRLNIKKEIRERIIDYFTEPGMFNKLTTEQKVNLYTLYKNFYEDSGDPVLSQLGLTSKTPIRSVFNAIKDEDNGDLFLALTKPIIESSRLSYMEINISGKITGVTMAAEKMNNNLRYVLSRSISKNAYNNDKNYDLKFATDDSITPMIGTSIVDVNDDNVFSKALEDLTDIDFSSATGRTRRRELLSLYPNEKDRKDLLNNLIAYTVYSKSVRVNNGSKTAARENIEKYYSASTNFEVRKQKRAIISSNNVDSNIVLNNTDEFRDFVTNLVNIETKLTGASFKATVKNVSGDSVAAISLHNVLRDTKGHWTLMNKELIEGNMQYSVSPLASNPFVINPNFASSFVIRSGVKNGDIAKPNSKLNVAETNRFNMEFGYFRQLLDSSENLPGIGGVPKVLFDVAAYSDKSANSLLMVADKDMFMDGAKVGAVSVKKIMEKHFNSVGTYYKTMLLNVLTDHAKIISNTPEYQNFDSSQLLIKIEQLVKDRDSTDPREYTLKLLQTYKELNDLLGTFFTNDKENFHRNYMNNANEANVDLTNFHNFVFPHRKLKDKNVLNMRLYYETSKYIDMQSYEREMKKDLDVFVKKLISTQGNKLLPEAKKYFEKYYSSISHEFINGNDIKIVNKKGQINPIIEKYFYDWNYVSENFMHATVGSSLLHINEKTMDDDTESYWKSWVAQVKRNVAHQATMHTYTMGLIDGVEENTNEAIIEDPVMFLQNVIGINTNQEVHDGSSLETMLFRIKSNNSLGNGMHVSGGIQHKSIGMSIDRKNGTFMLEKHAAHTITNERIRNSWKPNSTESTISFDSILKKMFNLDYSDIDITESWDSSKKLGDFSKDPVYYFDPTFDYDDDKAGKIMKITKLESLGNGRYSITRSEATLNAKPETVTVEIKNHYDLWKVLGGEWSLSLSNEPSKYNSNGQNFELSEESWYRLAEFDTYIGSNKEKKFDLNNVDTSHLKKIFFDLMYQIGTGDTRDSFADFREAMETRFGKEVLYTESNIKTLLSEKKDDKLSMVGINILMSRYDRRNNTNHVNEFSSIINNLIAQYITSDTVKQKFLTGMREAFSRGVIGDATVPNQTVKGRNIDRLNFLSSKKSGSKNQNPRDVLNMNNFAKLIYSRINNRNYGIQLNAEHKADDSELTAPTQIISAAIFNGMTVEESMEMYDAIASMIDIGMRETFTDPKTGKQYKESMLMLSKEYEKNRGKIQEVIKRTLQATVDENAEITIKELIIKGFSELPFDNSAIFKDAITTFANDVTKKSIRSKFAGTTAVITPSTGIQMLYEVPGGNLPFRQNDGTIGIKKLKPGTVLNSEEFKRWMDNPFVKGGVLFSRDTDGNIQLDIDGSPLYVEISGGGVLTPEQYQEWRNIPGNLETYGDVTKGGRDLKGQELILYARNKITGDEYEINLMETSYTRMMYLSQILKGVNKEDLVDLINNLENYADILKEFKKQYNRPNAYIDDNDLVEMLKEDIGVMLRHAKSLGYAVTSGMDLFKIARDIQRQFLKDITEGNYQGLADELALDNIDDYDFSYDSTPAEMMLPSIYKTKFLLSSGDSLNDVDEDFFRDKLKNRLKSYKPNTIFTIITTQLSIYGTIIKPDVKKGFTKLSNVRFANITDDDGVTKMYRINEYGEPLYEYDENNMEIYTKGEEEYIYFKKMPVENELKSLKNSINSKEVGGVLMSILHTASDMKNALAYSAEVNRVVDDKAIEMNEAFKKSLHFTVARIPGQGMQSFMGMKVAAFHESEANTIFATPFMLWLQGADMDIDKANALGFSIAKDGSFVSWNPAFNPKDLELSSKLKLFDLTQKSTILHHLNALNPRDIINGVIKHDDVTATSC